jgi:hypothetical protein
MSMKQKQFFLVVLMCLLAVFITGCSSVNTTQNSSQQIPPSALPSLSPTAIARQTILTYSSIIPITQIPIIKPDQTHSLTKDEAWHYAIPYFQSVGLSDIHPSEMKVSGPIESYGTHNNRTVFWVFEIRREDASGFEKGGIIFIDAYDGHMIGFAEFL